MYILFSLIIIYLFFRLVIVKKEIQTIERQLSNSENIRVMGSSKDLKNLAIQINKKLLEKEEVIISYRNNEKNLKDAISNISHDLRTPLTSILGYIQIVKKSNIADKRLDIIDERSTTLYKLVEELFELSLIDSGNLEVNIEKLNLENTLTNVIVSFYEQINEKNIELNIDIMPDDYTIFSDKVIVERILTNLMQNLIRYTKSFAKIKLYKETKVIKLIIENDGNVLSSNEVEKIFDRFYKADKSRNSRGTGLGLSIVKELCKKINVNIDVSANSNIISFKITFI